MFKSSGNRKCNMFYKLNLNNAIFSYRGSHGGLGPSGGHFFTIFHEKYPSPLILVAQNLDFLGLDCK